MGFANRHKEKMDIKNTSSEKSKFHLRKYTSYRCMGTAISKILNKNICIYIFFVKNIILNFINKKKTKISQINSMKFDFKLLLWSPKY